MDIKGTETEKNLMKAFACEAERRCEYNLFALNAKLEGLDVVGRQLIRLADHEREHAKIWYKWLHDGEFPSTMVNLQTVLEKEFSESVNMYPKFAAKAHEEGFEHIAELFEYIAKVEKDHTELLKKLIKSVREDIAPNADGSYNWQCSICDAVYQQKDLPEYCPFCANEDVFFFKQSS